ncbi:uncharacterized protein [Neodiprion pinetum]|uniref:Uncharacterized protein LOC107219386 isoform X3 n=1 Tax=Neodiprion lecontei TaxID=441921 RepID=A0ABM3G7N1_NEOLC|nr:uncharacterized protein LOC124219311 isoform X3 [Neodiprion pinetum]XP_046596277.1 uncharacterized protein LOC107219386 isoform X3 [Neodiprion lecontei]
MNIEGSGCGELQQLVQEEEGEEPPSRGAEVTPPSTPAKSNRQSKNDPQNVHISQQGLWENNTQTSPIISKESSGHATTSQGSMASGRAMNASNQTTNQSRLVYMNEKEKQKPNRPEPPRINRQHRGKDCSMEQMTEIREQQERLARLHFELGQRQETGTSVNGEQSGLRQSTANMRHLLHRLQQLSVCIEKLHSK